MNTQDDNTLLVLAVYCHINNTTRGSEAANRMLPTGTAVDNICPWGLKPEIFVSLTGANMVQRTRDSPGRSGTQ